MFGWEDFVVGGVRFCAGRIFGFFVTVGFSFVCG